MVKFDIYNYNHFQVVDSYFHHDLHINTASLVITWHTFCLWWYTALTCSLPSNNRKLIIKYYLVVFHAWLLVHHPVCLSVDLSDGPSEGLPRDLSDCFSKGISKSLCGCLSSGPSGSPSRGSYSLSSGLFGCLAVHPVVCKQFVHWSFCWSMC